MSAKARARHAAQWLPVLLFLGLISAAAVNTGATAAKSPVVAKVVAGDVSPMMPTLQAVPPAEAGQPVRAPRAIVVASLTPPTSNTSATPTATSLPPASVAPLISSTPVPAPARIFTINEVMAERAGHAPQNRLEGNIQLASVDPTATPDLSAYGKSDEPFGLSTLIAPDGLVWFKWRKVADDIRAEEPALKRCLANSSLCSPATARFVAIVKEAREHEGRVRFNFVNQRVNNAIRYTSDMAQWSTPDEWSAPLAAGKGSFETGLGDCEDYAIAKYVALRAAGVPAKQLRVLLVHDNIARLDHAVLAANNDGHWYVLDNRWNAAVEDRDVRRFTPLFALDDQGVKLLAVPYAARVEPMIEPMSEVVERHERREGRPKTQAEGTHLHRSSLDDAANKRPSDATLGLRPSIL